MSLRESALAHGFHEAVAVPWTGLAAGDARALCSTQAKARNAQHTPQTKLQTRSAPPAPCALTGPPQKTLTSSSRQLARKAQMLQIFIAVACTVSKHPASKPESPHDQAAATLRPRTALPTGNLPSTATAIGARLRAAGQQPRTSRSRAAVCPQRATRG